MDSFPAFCCIDSLDRKSVVSTNINLSGAILQPQSERETFPGNINSGHPTEKFISHLKLPLEELVSEAKNWKRLPMNDIILLGES